MFASLKSKIKEETGSDISKLTSSWRNGAFLGRITLRDDSVRLAYSLLVDLLTYPVAKSSYDKLAITNVNFLVHYFYFSHMKCNLCF